MPELPEVEVLRRSLCRPLAGDRFGPVRVHSPALREPLRSRQLNRLQGQAIERLRRRGKYLLVDTSEGDTLVLHLGMSGRLTLVHREEPLAAHEHVGFELESPRRLRFVDPRRFGLAIIVRTAGLGQDRHFRHLGVEPLAPDFDGALLAARAWGRGAAVKTFLMDAGVVVGVGNIYASEALYRAGIHPRRSVARIARHRFDRLAGAVREVLQDAIEQGGTTLNDFADGEGNSGYFQVCLDVYGREGETCRRACGAVIRRIELGARSSFYCPRCQR